MQDSKAAVGMLTLVIGLALGYAVGMLSAGPGTSLHGDQTHSSMEEAMHDMNAGLIGKEGDTFDQAFLEEMIVHHEGAVSMAQFALARAGHREIKDLASAIITAQEGEIAMMRDWLAEWYGK
jgi:uncharacterized protein (DUF305 family)